MELLTLDIIGRIAKELALEPEAIYNIAANASFRYRDVTVFRKGKSPRLVSQPSSELRLIQRWCCDRLFFSLPIHKSCFSYVKGKNITMHAREHALTRYLTRVDIQQFFPSLQLSNVQTLLSKHKSLLAISTDGEIDLVCKLVTRHEHLVIGAPSSPILSNALMFDFDSRWSAICDSLGVVYTRYADDIYMSTSTPNLLTDLLVALKSDLVSMPGFFFQINKEKDVYTSKKRLKRVTGVVITPLGKLSIGRHTKAKIKSLVHRGLNAQLPYSAVQSLLGSLSYIQDVEPTFMISLQKKYGLDYRERLKDNLQTSTQSLAQGKP